MRGLSGRLYFGANLEVSSAQLGQTIHTEQSGHAPYTKNLSGASLQLATGEVFVGSYAENAAFNPSLPPLQVALIQLKLAGHDFSEIEGAALVEMSEGSISHLADTQSTLEAINPDIPVSYLAI